MNTNENNGAPPAGGFGAPPAGGEAPLPFGPAGGWGQMQVAMPLPQPPGARMASLSLYLGISSIPGVFLCNMIGLPMAVAAVSLGIASLYRTKGLPNAPSRGSALGGLICGALAIAALASLLLYFLVFVPGFR